MKPATIPITCSLALATLSGAVASHWWSLREFGIPLANHPRWALPHAPVIPPPILATQAAPDLPPLQPVAVPDSKVVASLPAPPPVAEPSAAQKEFFESLLDEVKQLKQTNLALRDQMAETNRDLMKLEFRVDTHSASFRPLPVTEDLSALDTTSLDTSTQGTALSDDDTGVLPPRAVRVENPN